MAKPKILAFAGSLRTDSYNKKLIKVAVEGAKAAGADVTLIDLRDFPMPLYDGDIEKNEGLPDSAKAFKKILLEHRGLLISSPEYNSSISGVLKNSIDWASRSETNPNGTFECFENKIAGLMSASPGALGGLRGLVHVRAILSNMSVLVIPQQVAVSKANEAFDDQGKLKDAKQEQKIYDLAKRVTDLLIKLQ